MSLAQPGGVDILIALVEKLSKKVVDCSVKWNIKVWHAQSK
jgi:hypothetical protein